MKKLSLTEEILRIKELVYGKDVTLSEQETKDIAGKADYVEANVNDFFNTLREAAQAGGIEQQAQGSMNYQKSVESLQIGLSILGYEFPRFGVDGLFGPETAAAVLKFNKDNQILSESASDLRQTLSDIGVDEKGSELSSGGEITNKTSEIVGNTLRLIKEKMPHLKMTVTSGNDAYHQKLPYNSTHKYGQSVDFTISPYNSRDGKEIVNILNQVKSQESNFSFIDEYTNPSKYSTGGHFHLQYGDSEKAASGAKMVKASPEMIEKLISLLQGKNITDNLLRQYIDPPIDMSNFTILDLTTSEGFNTYATIAQRVIDSRKPNLLGITGKMIAAGAKYAYDKYKKYVPVELAMSQLVLEGGIGNKDPNSRPIVTKNPYNVGNIDSGENRSHNSVESGIASYFDLMARKYISEDGRVVQLNRYATNPNYTKQLNTLIAGVNRITQQNNIT